MNNEIPKKYKRFFFTDAEHAAIMLMMEYSSRQVGDYFLSYACSREKIKKLENYLILDSCECKLFIYRDTIYRLNTKALE